MAGGIAGRTLAALRKNGFTPVYAPDRASARQQILEMISPNARVGVGDSGTLRQIGIFDALAERGQQVINPFTREFLLDPANHGLIEGMLRRSLGNDVFITGSNALTVEGALVSVDYSGNRVAGMIFGAPEVVVVVSQNKIVANVEEALRRIKQVIRPTHVSWKRPKAPCARTGVCSDCNSPDRLCRVTVIIEKRPALTRMSVVLVGEDLGLGWDPSWPKDRIEAIRAQYQQVTWAVPRPKGATTKGRT